MPVHPKCPRAEAKGQGEERVTSFSSQSHPWNQLCGGSDSDLVPHIDIYEALRKCWEKAAYKGRHRSMFSAAVSHSCVILPSLYKRQPKQKHARGIFPLPLCVPLCPGGGGEADPPRKIMLRRPLEILGASGSQLGAMLPTSWGGGRLATDTYWVGARFTI